MMKNICIGANPSLETINQIKDVLKNETMHKGDKKSFSPQAWRLLSEIHSTSTPPTDKLGEIAWLCCQILHRDEAQLTLKKLDLEKQVCNVMKKFLDSHLVFLIVCC